jgi:hypothetical protein
MRCTVVYIGTVAIGLTVIEMSEEAEARYVNGEYVRLTDYVPKRRGRYAQDHGWTSTHDFPTGRLCLQAYSPYPRAIGPSSGERRPPGTFRADPGHCPGAGEGHGRNRAARRGGRAPGGDRTPNVGRLSEQWRREEEARRAAKALKDSKEELLQVIDAWAERSDSRRSSRTPNAARRIYLTSNGSAQ